MITPLSPVKQTPRFGFVAPGMPMFPAMPALPAIPSPQSWLSPAPMGMPPVQAWFPQRPLVGVRPVGMMPGMPVWENRLKELLHKRKSMIYALNLRTFAAQDKNGDGKIDPFLGESGTFLKAIPKLQELKAMGINTIHLLPINPIGKIDRLGELGSPGSLYSPSAFDQVNPEFHEPGSPLSIVQEARMFVDECHKNGIHVMVDIPSCASVDLSKTHPELMSRDAHGNLITPTNWIDIRMFVNDSPQLRAYYQRFFDLMVNQVGVDGFRADIARARSMAFWQHFTGKYPDKGWLGETYTEEDASPMVGLPRDVPEKLLRAGFDSIYGQYHIFHDMDANQYTQYVMQNQAMTRALGPQKSLIGSFWTHDDPTPMEQGGPMYCKLISAMMMVQPDTNPYILDGLTTGFKSHGDSHDFPIFDWHERPTGQHPEIGEYLKKMIAIRQSPQYGPLLSIGNFVPLKVEQDPKDPRIVSFLRQYNGRTLLVVANKDVNASHEARIEIPGLKAGQQLVNIAPNEGPTSRFVVKNHPTEPLGEISANVAPGRFYLFELQNIPNLSPTMDRLIQ